jgi:hypothetical protein
LPARSEKCGEGLLLQIAWITALPRGRQTRHVPCYSVIVCLIQECDFKGRVDMDPWYLAMFVLGLVTLGIMFAFIAACEHV